MIYKINLYTCIAYLAILIFFTQFNIGKSFLWLGVDVLAIVSLFLVCLHTYIIIDVLGDNCLDKIRKLQSNKNYHTLFRILAQALIVAEAFRRFKTDFEFNFSHRDDIFFKYLGLILKNYVFLMPVLLSLLLIPEVALVRLLVRTATKPL